MRLAVGELDPLEVLRLLDGARQRYEALNRELDVVLARDDAAAALAPEGVELPGADLARYAMTKDPPE